MMYNKVVVAAIAASVAAVFEGCKSTEDDLENVYDDYTKQLTKASLTVDDDARVAECEKLDKAAQNKLEKVGDKKKREGKAATALASYAAALETCKSGAPAVQVIHVYETNQARYGAVMGAHHEDDNAKRKKVCDKVKNGIDQDVAKILDANPDFKAQVVKAGDDQSALDKIAPG